MLFLFWVGCGRLIYVILAGVLGTAQLVHMCGSFASVLGKTQLFSMRDSLHFR